jgi:hypothetical protein
MTTAGAMATTYYVSSSLGNDANAGTSSSAPWQTLAHVNAQTFNPGDSILLHRGDVWNESLVPPSSGTAGNPITFDAYGVGAPPNFTGYYQMPTSGWINVTGNAWKAPLPAGYTTVSFCLFGSIWGQKVSAASSNLTAQWDFYLVSGYLYVYSVGNPSIYYNEPIVPMALSNVPVINVNSKTWLTFQHILVNWFDQYGVYVQGTSDHLVFANMEADSMIPQGTQPLGFYVDESAPGPGDIKIYNAEAHMNYDGFRFDGSATAITMVNDKAYANRDGALVDNTSAVTYSYCHFYASSLAVAGSTDVEWTTGTGPTAGAGNIAADTAPAVQVWQRYPARVTLTVDDIGMTPGADSYYGGTVLPVAQSLGVPVGVAVTTGYTGEITPLISEIQGWINSGVDVTAHSMSHTYYVNTNALTIQYTGSGTAATLSISGNVLTITVTGASDGVSYNLAQGAAEGTVLLLQNALNATGKYMATLPPPPCQGPYGTGCSAYTAAALLAQDLASVTSQDVKTNAYTMQLNVSQLQSDEINLSRQWMTTNLSGLPATPVYVYPGGYEDPNMEAMTAGVPYAGARGALHEGGTANNGLPIAGANDTYGSGYDVQDITSFGVNPTWMGITPAALNSHIQALVWKERVWGVPWSVFWHLNELVQNDPVGGTEVTDLVQDFANAGATIESNTGLVNWLTTGTLETGNDGNYYYKSAATSMAMNFQPTRQSPVVNAGENLGTAYEIDINGINQNGYGSGWEIGAHAFIGDSEYGVAGSGASSHFVIGTPAGAMGLPALPQTWVDNNEATDGLVYAAPQYELQLGTGGGTWIVGPPSGCTFTPANYTANPTGLADAVSDMEACRTASGGSTGFYLDVPAGVYAFSNGGGNGLVLPQTNSVPSSAFIVLRSTMDAFLPNGQTVCAHGIQDNVPTSTDIGMDNPDCTGGNMYFELGPTQTLPDNGTGTGSHCVSVSMSETTATFTLTGGTNCASTFPTTSFTVGQIVMGTSFTPNTYDNRWQILSINNAASPPMLTAQACPYSSAGATMSSCVTGLGASSTSGGLNADNIITGHYTLSASTKTLIPVTSAMVTAGIPIEVPLGNGYVSPAGCDATGKTCVSGYYIVDTGSSQEVVQAVSGPNQLGLYATFAKTHTFGVSVSLCVSNCTSGTPVPCNATTGCSYTLANNQAINTASYDDLQHMWWVTNTGGGPITACSPDGTSSTSSPPACGGTTTIGPDHWMIEDARFSGPIGANILTDDIAIVRQGSETAQSQLSSHIHFRKVGAIDDWTSLFTGSNSVSAGVALACVYCSLVDSQVSQIMEPGVEHHAISDDGTSSKFSHDWLEGGSSGLFSGGFSGQYGFGSNAAFSATYVPFCDIEERRIHFTYPFAWLGENNVNINFNPNLSLSSGWSRVRKMAQESKVGCRIVEAGNVYENTDPSGGNYTQARGYNIRNRSGGLNGSWYDVQINNVFSADNIYRHACNGIEMTRSDESGGNGGGTSYPPNAMYLDNLLGYDISSGQATTHPYCSGETDSYGLQLDSGQNSGWTGTLTVNSAGSATFVATSDNYTNILVGGSSGTLTTGTSCAGGTSATICSPSATEEFSDCSTGASGCLSNSANWWTGNASVIVNGTSYGINSCTSATVCTISGGTLSAGTGVSYSAVPLGKEAFDMSVGDPAPIYGCSGALAGANTPTITYSGESFPTLGYAVTSASAAWNGNTGFSTSNVSVNIIGDFSGFTLGTSDSTCETTNLQSSPQRVTVNHVDVITNNNHGIGNATNVSSGLAHGAGPNLMIQGAIINSILFGGWSIPASSDGCGTIGFMADETTLTNVPMVWPGETASNYSGCYENNNPNFQVGPSYTTSQFPTAATMCSYWAGSAACTSGTQNINVADYHVFEQASGSPYGAGGANDAADGLQQGPNIPAIDTAMTANIFACPYGCAFAAPYADVMFAGSALLPFTAGIDYNNVFPTAPHQIGRLWDYTTEWPYLNTCTNGTNVCAATATTFTWTNLDSRLQTMAQNGVPYMQMPLARTPNFASSNPSDTNCNDYVFGGLQASQLPGQCDPPSDLNTNGTGANLYWRNWAAALATHVNQAGYVTGTGAWAAGGASCPGSSACPHARLLIYETWNEPDDVQFFTGSYDQLIRMEQDLYCIVKGGAFTITATGETCAQVQATVTSVTLTAPVDPMAWVVMPSYHGGTTAMAQAFLYCTGSGVGSQSCHGGGAAESDAVNFHLKAGCSSGVCGTSPTMEAQLDSWVSAIQGILQPTELAKPLFNTEGGFNGLGWLAPYTDANMQASFVGRDYIYELQKKISNHIWYDWASGNNGLGSTAANTAYGAIEGWLAGAQFGGCVTSAPGTAGSGLYTYSCTLTLANGTQALAIWDNSQTCTPCTTTNQNVPAQYTNFLTPSGGALTPIVGRVVAVGIEPMLLLAGTA